MLVRRCEHFTPNCLFNDFQLRTYPNHPIAIQHSIALQINFTWATCSIHIDSRRVFWNLQGKNQIPKKIVLLQRLARPTCSLYPPPPLTIIIAGKRKTQATNTCACQQVDQWKVRWNIFLLMAGQLSQLNAFRPVSQMKNGSTSRAAEKWIESLNYLFNAGQLILDRKYQL